MPRTKMCQEAKLMKRPRQPILEMIVGRFATTDMTAEELAKAMGISRSTLYDRLKQPIEEWTYGEIIKACRALLIESEELCSKIRV